MSYVDAPLRGVKFSKHTIFYSKLDCDFIFLPYILEKKVQKAKKTFYRFLFFFGSKKKTYIWLDNIHSCSVWGFVYTFSEVFTRGECAWPKFYEGARFFYSRKWSKTFLKRKNEELIGNLEVMTISDFKNKLF